MSDGTIKSHTPYNVRSFRSNNNNNNNRSLRINRDLAVTSATTNTVFLSTTAVTTMSGMS